MMETETVSFRVRKDLKDLAKKYKIDIARIAREKVEQELETVQAREREEVLEKAADTLEKVTRQDISAAVRRSRDSR